MFVADYLAYQRLNMIKMRCIPTFIFISLFAVQTIYCQMTFNGKKLFGNEWLTKGQKYFKFSLADDGFCRIDYQTILNS